jgi:hypothetical protein
MDGVERILNNSWLPAVVTSVGEPRERVLREGFFGEKEGPNPTKDVYGRQ